MATKWVKIGPPMIEEKIPCVYEYMVTLKIS